MKYDTMFYAIIDGIAKEIDAHVIPPRKKPTLRVDIFGCSEHQIQIVIKRKHGCSDVRNCKFLATIRGTRVKIGHQYKNSDDFIHRGRILRTDLQDPESIDTIKEWLIRGAYIWSE